MTCMERTEKQFNQQTNLIATNSHIEPPYFSAVELIPKYYDY